MSTTEALAVGAVVAERDIHLTRESLVRYAGASGDFNPIHYRDDVAAEVGLPGVLAHGMLTMGLAAAALGPWLGDTGRIEEYGVRFTRPVVVDPRVQFGRPCLQGTGIPTEVLMERFMAGEPIDDIASDYGVDRSMIEAAIRFEKLSAA